MIAIAVACALAGCSDGDDGGAARIDAGDARLADATAWCTLAGTDSVALSAPSAAGLELVLLDMALVQWRALAAPTDGVPAEAIAAAGDIAGAYLAMRERVAAGEEPSAVLADAAPDVVNGDAAATLDRTIEEFCPASPFDEPG